MEKTSALYYCKDALGKEWLVYEIQEVIAAGHMKDPHATIDGMKRLETEQGYHVNFVSEEKFHIVNLGVDLDVISKRLN